ncbi:hypothetical protein IJ135_01905 [Candidatus Saccharibacteria bacterium]|nr:hypothetical protein [Candidatus Saccharibacteria bacterium]
MPVVATFAATPVQDRIDVTVSSTCTLNRTAGEGQYSTEVLPGQVSNNFGNSTLSVSCNGAKTVAVAGTFDALASGTNTIAYGETIANGAWATKVGNTAASATFVANNGNVLEATFEGEGAHTATASVWYSAGAASDQAAGTYSGYATYTLTENN